MAKALNKTRDLNCEEKNLNKKNLKRSFLIKFKVSSVALRAPDKKKALTRHKSLHLLSSLNLSATSEGTDLNQFKDVQLKEQQNFKRSFFSFKLPTIFPWTKLRKAAKKSIQQYTFERVTH